MHSLSQPFLQTYVSEIPSDTNGFSLRDLPTFYLPPYRTIIFRSSSLENLKNVNNYFDSFPPFQCNGDHIVKDLFYIEKA